MGSEEEGGYLSPGATSVPLEEEKPSMQEQTPLFSLQMPMPEHSTSTLVPAKEVNRKEEGKGVRTKQCEHKARALTFLDAENVHGDRRSDLRVREPRQLPELCEELDVDGCGEVGKEEVRGERS